MVVDAGRRARRRQVLKPMAETKMSAAGPVSQRFDVFLSYNSRDRASVERIAQRLKRAGLEPWVDGGR